MSGELGAAGDIATGALIGRAIEPRAGEPGHGEHNGMCLNCGTALIGDYCHACGQSGHIHRTIASIGHDLLHGVFHFEGKIWRTLPMLAWRPGELTRRYIEGERARFVSPLALFLFSVFLMFAVISAVGGKFEGADFNSQGRTEAIAQIDREEAKAKADLAKLEVQRAAAVKAGAPTASIDDKSDELRTTLKALHATANGLSIGTTRFTTTWHALDKAIARANANPGLTLYKIQSSAYKYSWALIPISTPFVALLFLWRRQYRMYDHALFVTYSLCFMTLWVVALTLLGAGGFGAWLVALGAVFVPPVHIARQLRDAYRLRWFSAIWRTFALLIFAFIALTVFISFLLTLGLME